MVGKDAGTAEEIEVLSSHEQCCLFWMSMGVSGGGAWSLRDQRLVEGRDLTGLNCVYYCAEQVEACMCRGCGLYYLCCCVAVFQWSLLTLATIIHSFFAVPQFAARREAAERVAVAATSKAASVAPQRLHKRRPTSRSARPVRALSSTYRVATQPKTALSSWTLSQSTGRVRPRRARLQSKHEAVALHQAALLQPPEKCVIRVEEAAARAPEAAICSRVPRKTKSPTTTTPVKPKIGGRQFLSTYQPEPQHSPYLFPPARIPSAAPRRRNSQRPVERRVRSSMRSALPSQTSPSPYADDPRPSRRARGRTATRTKTRSRPGSRARQSKSKAQHAWY